MPLLSPSGRTNDSGGRVTTSNRSRKTRIFLSYLPDWCLTVLLWGIFYLLDKINGYRRLFDITDTSLAHPHADRERVPVWLLAVLCGIVPAVVIIFVAALRRSFWDAQTGLLGLVLGLGLTITFTNIIKITVGRPRPDFFARCILPEGLTENPLHGLTSWTVCTQPDDSELQEGFRSFPSGHSSFAWAGMWYMILFLAAKMRINNRRGYTYKSWLLLAPLSCSTLITVSRTMDYRHHATDVLAGSAIGILFSWYAYRQYYPPLSHPQAYKPFSPRIPKDEVIPLHHRDHAHRPSTEGMLRPVQSDSQPGYQTESHHHLSNSTNGSDGLNQPPLHTGQGNGYPAGAPAWDSVHHAGHMNGHGLQPISGAKFGHRVHPIGQETGRVDDEDDRGDIGEANETVPRA